MRYDWLARAASIHKESSQINFAVKPSKIHGQGVFSVAPMAGGDVVGLALVLIEDNAFQRVYERNQLGLMINHASSPNGELRKQDNGYFLVVLADVPEDEEITVDYDEYYRKMEEEIDDTGKSVYVI